MTQSSSLSSLAFLQGRPLPLAAKLAVAFAVVCVTWAERRRTRLALTALEDHMLEDIGVTHAQAHKEARRPFWQG